MRKFKVAWKMRGEGTRTHECIAYVDAKENAYDICYKQFESKLRKVVGIDDLGEEYTNEVYIGGNN